MKKIVLFFCLLALSYTQDFNTQYVPEVTPDQGTPPEPEAAQTKFNFMDAPLIDLVWCGNKREVIFFLTEKNTLYRSVDDGFSGHRLTEHLEKLGKQELAGSSDVGQVARIIQAPSDKNMLIILGTAGVSWVTEDCGAGFRAMDTGRPVEEFIFHPTERNWLLASAWTQCEDFPGEPCKKYKELFVSKNLGGNWDVIASYVFQFSWGRVDQTFYRVPKERIIIAHEVGAVGNQKLANWSDKLEISFSDDFFKSFQTVLRGGNKFLITTYYFFAVQFNKEDTQTITLYVADPKAKNYTMRPVELPVKRLLEHSYTILDTAEHSVFLHVNHDGEKSEFGTIYVSDSTGLRYSASLPGNVINHDGQCDFERVQGVDGIYLANIVEKEARKIFKSLEFESFSQQGPGSKKTSAGTVTSNAAATARTLHDYKQTMISFNKGATWQLLNPPDKDSEGKKIICKTEEECFLHLHSISNTKFGPFYTTENSLGLILGTGNIGKYLSNQADEINTYLSRDGGLTWFEIAKGSHIYEIGDHGSIIVISPDQHATKEVYYSWNEGLTWETLVISEFPVEISNIIIEPSNTAEKFLIYGRETGETKRGVVIAADFTPIHKRECDGINDPDTPASDYETWTPGGKISPHCLLGKQTTYTRRKRDAECFNKEDHERWRFIHRCECTEDDWECDYGFVRVGSGPCLPLDEKATNKDRSPPEECEDFYYVTQGYRKVGGNQCDNGITHDPIQIPCPRTITQKSQNIMAIVALSVVILVLIWRNGKGKSAKNEKFGKIENAKPWFSSLKNLFNKIPMIGKKGGKGENGFVKLDEEPESMRDDENVFGKIEFEGEDENEQVEEYNQDQITQRRKMTERRGIETANKHVPILHRPGEKKGTVNLL